MLKKKLTYRGKFPFAFSFESYGVGVKIESNQLELLAEAHRLIKAALLNRIEILEDDRMAKSGHSFGLASNDDGIYFFFQNGKQKEYGESRANFLNFFMSMLRVTVAEHAVSKVFVHAGVVGWKGKAILAPASSFHGKSTLIAELVKNGAYYYSDEYAVLDENGMVHPFPRPLSIRGIEDQYVQTDVSVESLGGKVGIEPLPVGLILITQYRADSIWDPEFLTTGQGVIEMIPHTIPIRFNTEFSIKVLKKAASRAIIAKGYRPDAKIFAKSFLSFFDIGRKYVKII